MYARFVALATVPIAIALVAAYLLTRDVPAPVFATATIGIGESSIVVELATSSAAREKGLGGRDGLAPDTGMLFVFPRDGAYAFWMKDMRFPIDMLWLDANGRVVTLRGSVSPDTYPAVFSATEPARFVLELPAGYADRHSISLGERLVLPHVGESD